MSLGTHWDTDHKIVKPRINTENASQVAPPALDSVTSCQVGEGQHPHSCWGTLVCSPVFTTCSLVFIPDSPLHQHCEIWDKHDKGPGTIVLFNSISLMWKDGTPRHDLTAIVLHLWRKHPVTSTEVPYRKAQSCLFTWSSCNRHGKLFKLYPRFHNHPFSWCSVDTTS